jgi:hypothetical protein
MGEFFRTLPEVGRQLLGFIDGFFGIAVVGVSVILAAVLLFLAHRWRDTRSWLSAMLGGLAVTIGMWWAFGIIPSAWIYFVDGQRDLLAGTIIPRALPGMSNFFEVFRDSVVVGETAIAVIALAIIAGQVQRRYPRALADGEDSRPQSGGYK